MNQANANYWPNFPISGVFLRRHPQNQRLNVTSGSLSGRVAAKPLERKLYFVPNKSVFLSVCQQLGAYTAVRTCVLSDSRMKSGDVAVPDEVQRCRVSILPQTHTAPQWPECGMTQELGTITPISAEYSKVMTYVHIFSLLTHKVGDCIINKTVIICAQSWL